MGIMQQEMWMTNFIFSFISGINKKKVGCLIIYIQYENFLGKLRMDGKLDSKIK